VQAGKPGLACGLPRVLDAAAPPVATLGSAAAKGLYGSRVSVEKSSRGPHWRYGATDGGSVIESIEVSGFRTLRQVTIPLGPGITVLVGANNSGKSNVMAVLGLLYATARSGNLLGALSLIGGASAFSRGANLAFKLIVQFRDGDKQATYEVGLPATETLSYVTPTESGRAARNEEGGFVLPRGSGIVVDRSAGAGLRHWSAHPNVPAPVAALHRALSGIVVRDLSVPALRESSAIRAGVVLERDGRNIAAVLDELDPDLREGVERDVKAAASEVKRVLTRNAAEPGKKIVGVQETNGGVFTADEMSDGLLLFIGLSVSMALTDGVSLIGIEEPERGVHPRRLRDLLDLLKRVTERGRQVVLTTHSPELLDEFRDQPESVLILDRDETGTHVTRLSDRADWISDLQDKPLGDIWYSGILGGVPKK
jgi:predicted ATPase